MYKFVDTTEPSAEMMLPTEAMSIDGIYLESAIDGYRTLYTSGREILAPSNTTTDLSTRDGAIYQGRRYPVREIKVGYQLICKTAKDFRYAYNQLAYMLNTIDGSKLIFADEPDKYYIGDTVKSSTAGKTGVNCVTGDFTVYCADPHKYKIAETVLKSDADGYLNVNYKGTVPAYPILEAEIVSDCSYIAWINNEAVTIIVGNDASEDSLHEGDMVRVDCASGNITVNGTERLDLGSLGNDFDDFCLSAGTNKIEYISTATEVLPFTLTYREAYL